MNKKILAVIFMLVLIAVVFAGCNEEGTTSPSIASFSVTPNEINYGETANLVWNVTNAETVSIDNEIGTVSLEGTRVIQPTKTTTYTLTASKSGKTVTATTQIIVDISSIPTPVIVFIKNSVDKILTVASVDPLNLNWADVTVIGIATLPTGDIVAGDTITGCSGTVTLRWDPTITLLGIFEFT